MTGEKVMDIIKGNEAGRIHIFEYPFHTHSRFSHVTFFGQWDNTKYGLNKDLRCITHYGVPSLISSTL
jgi:hypothetical protein